MHLWGGGGSLSGVCFAVSVIAPWVRFPAPGNASVSSVHLGGGAVSPFTPLCHFLYVDSLLCLSCAWRNLCC